MRVALAIFAFVLAQQPAFKSGVDLVRIPVNVTRSGQLVTDGLTAADFVLKEDGATQTIAVFEREALPISLCIAVDVSGSMSNGPIELAMMAIRDLSAGLQAQDELSIITFAESARVLVPWSAPGAAARMALSAELGGGTSLTDATRAALDMVETARNARSVVLLITDGFENASRFRLSDVIKTRRQSETLVYAFEVRVDRSSARIDQMGTPLSPPQAAAQQSFASSGVEAQVSYVPSLVGDSGGIAYPLSNNGDLQRGTRRFFDELRNQYTIGYTPAKALDGKYRRVKVELTKRGYQIRHRGGYLALPPAARQ